MRKSIISTIVLAFAMVSCGDLGEMSNDYKDGIVITLKGAGAVTKADTDPNPGAGDDALNENKVESLCYFIYDADGALLHSGSQSFSPALTVNEPTKVRLNVSETDFDRIFTTERPTVSMYIVANVDADNFTNLSAKNDIKAVEVAIQNGGAKQDNFVMSGEGEVSKNTDGSVFKATGSVDLTRSLAKLTLNLNIRSFYGEIEGQEYIPGPGGNEGTIDIDIESDFDPTKPETYTQYWTPQYAKMEVTFHNGASNGTVGGATVTSPTLFNLKGSYNTAAPDETDEINEVYKFNGKLPYYTYARTWEKHQLDAESSDTKPYFLIMLPWQKYGASEFQNTWYKIVLNTTEFVANSWYNITVSLNGLGSLTNGAPVEVTPLTFEVGSWRESIVDDTSEVEYNTVSEVQSDEVRVLSFNQKDITLIGRSSISIPYTTTHDCIISSIVLNYTKYKEREVSNLTASVEKNETATISLPNPEGLPNKTATATLSGGYLTFSHELVNDYTANAFDYQPYVYTITVEHENYPSFNEKIVIRQNPSLIIGYTGGNVNTVYVNNNHSSVNSWDIVAGQINESGNNCCPYVYSITASMISSEGMTLGDPRLSEPQTAAQLGINDPAARLATAWDETTRTLTYYYATDPNANDVLAPKISIASAWSQQQGPNPDYSGGWLEPSTIAVNVDLNTAKYRCATYQEVGKPAGRWRLPTEAELNFIGKLCAKGMIPTIFYDGQHYFAASGAYKYNSSRSTFEAHKPEWYDGSYVRCVYDDWYWENSSYPTCPTNQFTWGDMPM